MSKRRDDFWLRVIRLQEAGCPAEDALRIVMGSPRPGQEEPSVLPTLPSGPQLALPLE